MTDAFAALVDRIEAPPPAAVRASATTQAAPAASAAPPEDEEPEGQTFVMDRRPGPAGMRARLISASSGGIDAFVERAFGTLSLEATPAPEDVDAVPPRPAAPAPPTLRRGWSRSGRGRSGRRPVRARPPRPRASPASAASARSSRIRRAGAGPRDRSPCSSSRASGALRRGETDSARRAWQEALGLDPSNRMLALNLRRLDAMGASPGR